jgi:hypothetical protein
VDEALRNYWQAPDAAPETITQIGALTGEQLDSAIQTLFADPAMAHWVMPGRAILRATPASVRPDPTLPVETLVRVLLREISGWPESAALAPSMERGLRAQAAWFHLAGLPAQAGEALRLATWMIRLPIPENPILAHMLTVGLGPQTIR